MCEHSDALVIRPYRPADEEALVALWKSCQLTVPHNDPYQDIRRKIKVNPEWLLVAEQNGHVVASCMIGYDGHRGWINYLAVAPDRRNQQIGGQLVAKAELILRNLGCPKINLQVRSSNLAVIRFYEKLGFRQDGVTSLGKRLESDEGWMEEKKGSDLPSLTPATKTPPHPHKPRCR